MCSARCRPVLLLSIILAATHCVEASDGSGLSLLQTRASINTKELSKDGAARARNSTANFSNVGSPGIVAIYVSYNGGDHFYHEAATVPEGYTGQGIAFYAHAQPTTGTVPIYGYYNPQLAENYYLQATDVPDGYVAQGVEFYAFAEQMAYTSAIYAFWNAALSDHYYSMSAAAPEGYTSQGVQFYAYSRPPTPQIVSCVPPLTLSPGTLMQDSLGGNGTVRYGGVTTVDGKAVDLVVVSPDYVRPSGGENGFDDGGKMWNMPQSPNTTTTLQFSFVNSSNSLVTMSRVAFTFFDIDGNIYGNLTQTLELCGTEYFYRASNSSIWQESLSGGCTRFSAVNLTNVQNPADPMNLTKAQQNHAVTAVFSTTSSFTVTTSLSPGKASKPLLFAGVQALGSFC